MIDYLGMVREFHEEIHCWTRAHPGLTSDHLALERLRLINEEVAELTKAMAERDLVEIADSLADILYVIFGSAVVYGLPMDKIFKQVHQSNMSKAGGYLDKGGKFIKPSTYKPVDLSWLLRETQ